MWEHHNVRSSPWRSVFMISIPVGRWPGACMTHARERECVSLHCNIPNCERGVCGAMGSHGLEEQTVTLTTGWAEQAVLYRSGEETLINSLNLGKMKIGLRQRLYNANGQCHVKIGISCWRDKGGNAFCDWPPTDLLLTSYWLTAFP